MLKLLAMPFYFFRELIFESKDEYDIKSTSFNTKKVITFCLMVLSIGLNIVMFFRVVELAVKNIDLTEKIEILTKDAPKVPAELVEDKGASSPTRSTEK